ncbi:MAG TPA: ECF-type sigma factor [Tepidisphaeraceae bacterium]|nr:ECF-type sigma factor [Tepidisphaeraceae bacterium]
MEQAAKGAPASTADLFPLVYESLKELARKRMSLERCGHTLQATALVHEAYLRLARKRNICWSNRAHFFHAAAEAMRQILIEHARTRGRVKRGGGSKPLPIHLLDLADRCDCEEVLALDEAIQRLEEHTPDIAAVVRFRFFAGLSVAETADSLGMGRRSVDRAWSYARVWLYRELYGNGAKAGS